MEYLDCECTYFPSMADDDPIMSAYSYAKREGVREGFVPVLIQADDETLLEMCIRDRVYFQKHAPKEVLEHWNILVGRQPLQNIGLRTEDGWDISGEDVQIWLEEQGENSFAITAYCEKLLPMLREEEGRAWWMLTTLTDQVLGEIPHMRYIDSFDVLEMSLIHI